MNFSFQRKTRAPKRTSSALGTRPSTKISDFGARVYNVVRKIPRGKVLTYADVARKIGNPKAVRAVGNALNKNRNKDVPCHRVIRSDGKVGGYYWGTAAKVKILKKEKAI